jgi:hypothetical protein
MPDTNVYKEAPFYHISRLAKCFCDPQSDDKALLCILQWIRHVWHLGKCMHH